MDNADRNLLHKLALKLCIVSPAIIKKAEELVRLLDVKTLAGGNLSMNVTGTCKTIVCLELAAHSHRHQIDKVYAVKLSGVTKLVYNSTLKTIELLLNLQPEITIPDLAVQFGCPSQCSAIAAQILLRYEQERKKNGDLSVDTEHTQKLLYVAASLYKACKKMNYRIDKRKLLEVAGCRRLIFDNMCAILEKYVPVQQDDKSEAKNSKRAKSFVECLEETWKIDGAKTDRKRKLIDEAAEQSGDYEEWKKKILQRAALSSTNS